MGAAVVEDVAVKDCPHCGSKASLKTDSGGAGTWFWVKCSNKGCAASHVSKPSGEEATTVWNARA